MGGWRQALETYGFRLSRSKTKYMECNFIKRQSVSSVAVKVGDHIISQITQFKCLGSIVQNDGEIEGVPQVFYVMQKDRLS